MDTRDYLIKAGERVDLKKIPIRYKKDLDKKDVKNHLAPKNLEKLQDYQEKLYAENKQGLITILQAANSGGKGSLIRHVMTGLNPQDTRVASFKRPSDRELDHDFLWRVNRELPSREDTGIFNRSHCGEATATRIHGLVKIQPLPEDLIDKDLQQRRSDSIVNYEYYLRNNDFRMAKFFLHTSKEEQESRLMDRTICSKGHYKFGKSDITERTYWGEYQRVYEDSFEHVLTKEAPWYVVPVDCKWSSHHLVSQVILEALQGMDP